MMNRDCEKYYGLIEDLTAGEEVEEQLAAQTEAHLSSCAECREEYEFQRREKEMFARFLFDFEPSPDAWANLRARLSAEDTASGSAVTAASEPRRKGRVFDFGFSPAFAAAAVVLLFSGIGFVLLRNTAFEKNSSDVAETKPESSFQSPNGLPAKDVAPKNSENGKTARRDKKQAAFEIVKIKPKADFSAERKKNASENVTDRETRSALLRRQKLETEIASQIEKIELLLRSFRNVRLSENVAGFDVEYEKRQARRLLETNAALQRDAEKYGISYAGEVLNRAEPYLLEIANLGNNPAPDKILDIKERVSSQNIIASLQVYNTIAATR